MREKNTEDREKWGRRKDAIYILAAITLGTLASGVMLAAAFPDSDLVRAVKDHFIIQDGDPTPPLNH